MNLLIMFTLSLLAGYLATMNLWAARCDDARVHLNDIYMVLLMTCWMILFMVMIYYRHTEYANQLIVVLIAAIIFFIYAIRKQLLIDDKQFMEGMIPHHSMAITMAREILKKTHNPELQKLAENIISSQSIEIEQMNKMLKNY